LHSVTSNRPLFLIVHLFWGKRRLKIRHLQTKSKFGGWKEKFLNTRSEPNAVTAVLIQRTYPGTLQATNNKILHGTSEQDQWNSSKWGYSAFVAFCNWYYSWFQTFAVFRMLYSFFWVIHRRRKFVRTFRDTLPVPSS
jgi:hypothetical protein